MDMMKGVMNSMPDMTVFNDVMKNKDTTHRHSIKYVDTQ